MNDEINIKFGGDTSGLATALRGVKGMVTKAADSIKDSFKDAFHHLFAPISVAGAFEAVKSLMEDVKNIKRISESTGLDTGITQDLLNLGKASGVASDQIESMMDKFVKNLAPGTDPETALMGIADKMATIEDPATRAAYATSLFGKSGAKLIPILEQGSEGIKKLASEWGKLTDAEIDQLEQADRTLEKTGQRSKVVFAQILDGLQTTGDKFKNMPLWKKILAPVGLIQAYKQSFDTTPSEAELAHDNATEAQKVENAKKAAQEKKAAGIKAAQELAEKEEFIKAKPQEKVLMLTRKILELRREMEDTESEKERAKLAEKMVAAEEKRDAIQKEISRKADEQAKKDKANAAAILKTQTEITKLGRDRERERMSEYLPTIQEVAQSGYMTFRHNQWEFQQGPFAQMAQRLEFLQADAKQALLFGNRDRFNQDVSRIDDLKKALTQAGVMSPDDKLTSIDEKIGQAKDHLKDLTAMAANGGIKVTGGDDE